MLVFKFVNIKLCQSDCSVVTQPNIKAENDVNHKLAVGGILHPF